MVPAWALDYCIYLDHLTIFSETYCATMDFICNLKDKLEGGCNLADPGVKIDDDVDGSHDYFRCDENNDCN